MEAKMPMMTDITIYLFLDFHSGILQEVRTNTR
jgi:hypothetical protein